MSAMEKISLSAPATPQATLVHVTEQAHWEQLAAEFHDYDYRQSWSYGSTSAERYRARIERIAVQRGPELLGIAQVRIKPIPFLGTGIAHVGSGPITRRDQSNDTDNLKTCLRALQEEFVAQRGYTLRILPPIHPAGGYDAVCKAFRECGFKDSPWPPPYRTVIVDVNRPLPDIRKTLAQKWRNCLNNSERQNLTLSIGGGPELFQQFEALFDQFMQRKQISVEQGADFYRELRSKASSDEGFLIILALSNGVPAAGQLISLLGNVGISILGASNEIGMKNKAAYTVQWHCLVQARERGIRYYDLGGIDPDAIPGVHHFKSGLGGVELSGPGPFQLAPPGMRESVTNAVERIYRWSLRLKRRG
jgi:hypothetical protein